MGNLQVKTPSSSQPEVPTFKAKYSDKTLFTDRSQKNLKDIKERRDQASTNTMIRIESYKRLV